MNIFKHISLAIFLIVVSTGCGSQPPTVTSSGDVQRLDPSTRSARTRWLADRDISSLARLRDLRALYFSDGNAIAPAKITDEGLATLAMLDLPYLEMMSLGWCDNITDAGLKHISRLPTITMLLLTSCPNITDAGLNELVASKSLTYLDLRACPGISDAGIQQLATKTNWETIELGGCPKLTAAGVAKLQAALPKARVAKCDEEWALHGPESHNPPWRKQKQ